MIWLVMVIVGVVALILREVERAPIVDDSYEYRLWEEISAERKMDSRDSIKRDAAA